MLWVNPAHLVCPGRSAQTAQMRSQVRLSFGVKIQGQKRAQGGRLHLMRSVSLLIIRAVPGGVRHLKVIQETCTAETPRTQRFLYILCALCASAV